MSECLSQLFATLGEFADEPVEQSGPTGDFVYVEISSVDRETKKIVSPKSLPLAKAPSRARQVLRGGDVLVSMTRPNLNAVALVPDHLNGAIGSTGFHVLRSRWLRPEFVFGLVQSQRFVDEMSALVQGALYPAVRPKDIAAFTFAFETPAQQTRIVAKLEELLSDLDAGVAELKAAQKKLQQYRQSLLKAAVEGALTAPWREAQRKLGTPNETGAQLLQRILTERRARWEARQLAKFKKQGKAPPKDWQKKYPEPFAPDTSALPELPQGWVWASLDALICDGPQNGLYLPGNKYGSGVPILRIDDFQIGRHRELAALNRVEASPSEVKTYALATGDLVVNRVNSMTHLGKSLLVSDQMDGALFESNMMRLSLSAAVSGAFVVHYLGSDVGRARLIQGAKWAVNQASINQQDVRRTPVPLMPSVEQEVIAQLLAELLGAAAEQESAIAHALRQSTAQRQNILRAAFAGQLVPQDPNDEPASVLLERIRAERGGRATLKKPRKAREAA